MSRIFSSHELAKKEKTWDLGRLMMGSRAEPKSLTGDNPRLPFLFADIVSLVFFFEPFKPPRLSARLFTVAVQDTIQ
jgi:hypothetical protein